MGKREMILSTTYGAFYSIKAALATIDYSDFLNAIYSKNYLDAVLLWMKIAIIGKY
jgi:hypothetical protein